MAPAKFDGHALVDQPDDDANKSLAVGMQIQTLKRTTVAFGPKNQYRKDIAAGTLGVIKAFVDSDPVVPMSSASHLGCRCCS